MKVKRVVIIVVMLVIAALGVGSAIIIPTVTSAPRLFERNADLKAQGYYMAEFEFKMEAALYHLNNGSYSQAFRTLRRIDHEMSTLDGLVKMPQQASTDELIEFLLERQNPTTGAFMDPAYPFFTFIGPTANVLDQLDKLSAKAGRTIKLKYPLRFLDEIRTPQQLRAYLDSLLYFQPRWADKFGGPTPYCPGVSELSHDSLLLFERIGGYRFTNEWKVALTQWFYEMQDPKTGLWGARIGDKDDWRQALDIDSTSHILQHFLDERGESRNPKYPLRYAESLAHNLLKEVAVPMPDGAVEQHEWSLRQAHAAKIITRWLWPSLSEDFRKKCLLTMPKWLEARFAMYRAEDGGFAVDSSSQHADIDATTTAISFLENVGFIPATWQRQRLREKELAAKPNVGQFEITRWESDIAVPTADINSLRVYMDQLPATDAWDDSSLVRIVYPHPTRVPDIMDLRQGLARYIVATGGEFGNWTTKASLRQKPLALNQTVNPIPISQGSLDLAQIARENSDAHRLFVVGLDRFQIPVFRHEYFLK
jgi:hypothetical protein